MRRTLVPLLPVLVAFACTTPGRVDGETSVTPAPAAQSASANRQGTDVYVMSADGRGLKRLTRHPLVDGTPVVWSPRGDRIMYGRGVEGRSGTYVMNRDGSDPVELMPPRARTVAGSWLSDGTIVLSSRGSGADLLYTMTEGDRELRRIPNTRAGDFFPVASPDGTKVAFMSEDGPESDIWTMSMDGSNRVPLAVAPLAQKWATWSPDGTKLAYHDLPSETIRIAEIDSGVSRRLDLDRPALMPAWSPDGRKMAFISAGDVCVVALANRESVCFDKPGQAYGPSWSPNGRLIAFVYTRE